MARTSSILLHWLLPVLLLIGFTVETAAQRASFESKLVEVIDVRLQYHDFGGSGLPVIFVQVNGNQ